jgi:putative tryptophan/tyrosine transport system substrate-binding protein
LSWSRDAVTHRVAALDLIRRPPHHPGMDRRRFLLTSLTGAFGAPLAGGAQQPAGRLWRLGVLMNLYPPDADPPAALRQGLRHLGYVEGQNLVIDWRYQLGQSDRLPALAAELVRLKPDVLVADVTVAIRAAMQATSTVPIVMASSADALGSGLVTNLGRPAGNVTGVTIMLADLTRKRLQLLKEMVPNASRVAVLRDPAIPWHRTMLKEIEVASPGLRLQPVVIAVRSRDDLGDALSEMAMGRVDSVFVSHTMTPRARGQIIDFAAKNRLPTMFMERGYIAAGGLMSYGSNFSEQFRHAAEYVAKILKGARPGDLPIEQPTKFEFVINLTTAKALGLTIPPSLLARADQVIE